MKKSAPLLLVIGCMLGCGRASERPSASEPSSAPVGQAAVATPGSATPSPAPGGATAPSSPGRLTLRGLRWGEPLPAGFRLLATQSKSESAYFDPKETLSVQGVAVLDISYRFIDGRFSAMAVQGAPERYPALVAALKKKWGRPIEEDPGRVKWIDSETTALIALSEPAKPFVLIVIDNAAVERAQAK